MWNYKGSEKRMLRHEFVLFYANLSFKERRGRAVLLTYDEVWNMLEVFKKEVKKE